MRRPAIPAVLAAAALLGAGCGGASKPAAHGARLPLDVAAVASLKGAFTTYARTATDVDPTLSFEAPAALAARLRTIARRPDVVAFDEMATPAALYAKGLIEKPIAFASNTLEIAIRPSLSRQQAIGDVTRPGVRVAIAPAGVALGAQTRALVGRLPAAQRSALLANVTTQEADVAGIVAKLEHGSVDAAVLYQRDVRAANDRAMAGGAACCALTEIPIVQYQPSVQFGAAVVRGTRHEQAAELFIYGLLSGPGQVAISHANFAGPSPT